MNCKLCGAKDIQPSFGGVDICGTCDCLGFCRRCKILAEENERLRNLLGKELGI